MNAPFLKYGDSNMTPKKTLYLANPYGFSLQQRAGPLGGIVTALEALGAEVWEPFARNNQIDRARPGWAYEIGQADLRDVRQADGLFAVLNGCPPDEGVMVELGMAIAWAKPMFLFRDDFRRCTDSEVYPLNLMLLRACPRRAGKPTGTGRLRRSPIPTRRSYDGWGTVWCLQRHRPRVRNRTGKRRQHSVQASKRSFDELVKRPWTGLDRLEKGTPAGGRDL